MCIRDREKDSGMADAVPEQARHEAGHEPGEPNGRAVPADAARADLRGDEVTRESFPRRPEYSLEETIEEEEAADEDHVPGEREAEIGRQEDGERNEQQIPAAEPVRQGASRVGDQCGD